MPKDLGFVPHGTKSALLAAFLCLLGAFGEAATTTPRMGLTVPAFGDANWDVQLRSDASIIDTSACVLGQNNTFTGTNVFSNPLHLVASALSLYPVSDSLNGSFISPIGSQELSIVAGNGTGINTGGQSSFAGFLDLWVEEGTDLDGLPLNGGRFAVIGSSKDGSAAYSGFRSTAPISKSTLWSLPRADGTNGQILSTDGSSHLSFVNQTVGGGGGASLLAVNQNAVQITSPTVAVNALSPPFVITSIAGGATAQWTLSPSSVTLNGPLLTQGNTWAGFNNFSASTTFSGNLNISSGVLVLGGYGANGQILTSGGFGAVPSWSTNPGLASLLSSANTWTGSNTYLSSATFGTGSMVWDNPNGVLRFGLGVSDPLSWITINNNGDANFLNGAISVHTSSPALFVTTNTSTGSITPWKANTNSVDNAFFTLNGTPRSAILKVQPLTGPDQTILPLTIATVNQGTPAISSVTIVLQSTGVTISSATAIVGPLTLWNLPIATINGLTPSTTGQMVFCQDCAANGGKGTLCVSTGTTTTFQFVLSTGTACK